MVFSQHNCDGNRLKSNLMEVLRPMFISSSDKCFCLVELMKLTGIPRSTLHDKLVHLKAMGLIDEKKEGNEERNKAARVYFSITNEGRKMYIEKLYFLNGGKEVLT